MRRVHMIIRGRVQGVFFRGSTRRQARALGLMGWVRNKTDGTVEAVAEGPDDRVAKLIEWCHDGPPMAQVFEVDFTDETPTGREEPFHVKRGW